MGQADGKEALDLESIKSHRYRIVVCSAMEGTNVREGIEWVVQDAKDRMFLY